MKRWTSSIFSHAVVAAIAGSLAWKASEKSADVLQNEERHELMPIKNNGDVYLDKLCDNASAIYYSSADSLPKSLSELKKNTALSKNPKEDIAKKLDALKKLTNEDGNLQYDNLKKANQLNEELVQLFAQWLKADPVNALKEFVTLNKAGAPIGALSFLYMPALINDQVEKMGFQKFSEAVTQADARDLVKDAMCQNVAMRGSLSDLKELMKWGGISGSSVITLTSHWDLSKKDELLSVLTTEQQAKVIRGLAERMKGDEATDWILSKLNNEEIKKQLSETSLGNYQRSMNLSQSQNNLTLDQRITIMKALGTWNENDAKRAKNEMIFDSLMSQTRGAEAKENLYRFRNGLIDANEAYASLTENAINAGTYAHEQRSQTYRTLAQENPQAALQVISHLSPTDQEWEKVNAARWWFVNSRPEDFYQFTETIQTEGNPNMQKRLEEAWDEKSFRQLATYGEDYFPWIQSLPEGKNKTLALQAFIKNASDLPEQVAKAKQLLHP